MDQSTHPNIVDVQVVVLFGSDDPGNHVGGSDVRVVIGPVLSMTNPARKGPWQTWVYQYHASIHIPQQLEETYCIS